MIDTKKNVRIIITISKKQFKWIEDFSNKKHLSKSKLISWLLAKKTEDVISTLKLNTNPKEEVAKVKQEDPDANLTDEEFRKKYNI